MDNLSFFLLLFRMTSTFSLSIIAYFSNTRIFRFNLNMKEPKEKDGG